jgi:tetratricopeptide (TPR) repeat protein
LNRLIIPLVLAVCAGCSLVQPAEFDEGAFNSALAKVRTLTEEGRFQNAQTELNAISRPPKSAEYLYYKAFLTHKVEGKPRIAVKWFRKALDAVRSPKIRSSDPLLEEKIIFYMSYALAESGKKEEAAGWMNAAFSLLERLDQNGRLVDGQGYYLMAYCYDRRNEPDLSRAFYEKAIAAFSTNSTKSYYLAGSYFNVGLQHYNAKEYAEAVQWWEKALAAEPPDGAFREYYRKWYETARQAAGLGF